MNESPAEGIFDDRPRTPRRLMAAAVATLAGVIAYWAVVAAVAVVSDTGTVDETTGFAIALGFVMLTGAFLLLAWLTRSRNLVRMAFLGAAVGVVLWTWLPFAVGEVLSPFAAAFGCGAALALRVDPPQRIWHRLIAVGLTTVYVFAVARFAFTFALLVTPFLPLPAILAADAISERSAS